MDERMIEWIHECIDKWLIEWMDGWLIEWINDWMSFLNVKMKK